MKTLASFMVPFCEQSSRDFISEQSAEGIGNITKHFTPAVANDTFCFELRLGKINALIDYSLHFSREHGGQDTLLRIAATPQDTEQLNNNPLWQAIFAFARQWKHTADHVWLEFDLDQQQSGAMPLPSLFYCAASPSYQNEALQHSEQSYIQQETIRNIARIFLTPEDLPEIFSQLEFCIEHAPKQAQLNQVGFGLTRNRQCIRLQFIGVHPQQIPDYLQTIGWRGDIEPLLPMLEYMSALPVDLFALVIDAGKQIAPKIGIECYLKQRDQRWNSFLAELVNRGLCLTETQTLAQNYPSVQVFHTQQEISLTHLRFSHIKIGYDQEHGAGKLEAKAYLFHFPDWKSFAV